LQQVSCVVCDKTISVLFEDADYDKANFSDGVVGKISAGFGSSHDGDVYVIGICDKCIDKKKIQPVSNYLFDTGGI